jgi:hypothetical protein
MAPLPIAGTTVQGFGAGLDARSAFQVGAPVSQAQMVDPACAVDLPDAAGDPSDTDNVQAENGADDVAEGDTGPDNAAEDASEGAGDTGTQQCGDQSENGNAAP